jgi:AGCS family alanine or glycine:cation symporter
VPTFDANKYPEIRSQLEEGIWDNPTQHGKQL